MSGNVCYLVTWMQDGVEHVEGFHTLQHAWNAAYNLQCDEDVSEVRLIKGDILHTWE